MKIALTLLLLWVPTLVQAQTRVPHIGILVQELGRAQSQTIKGVKLGLQQLGYAERKHLRFETRDVKGDRSALPAAAKELVAKNVEVIFTTGTRATLAAAKATQAIPIVFVYPGDPVARGLIKNVADAARNITGVAAYGSEATEKRLVLFKEIVPTLTTIHVFFDANSGAAPDRLGLTESAAKKIGMQLIGHGIKSSDELKTTFGNLVSEARAGVFQISDDLIESEAEFIFSTARQKKLPTMFNEEGWAIAGATAAYGPSYLEMGRHAAGIIDQILKGKAPATIAVVRSRKFDLTINYRGAKYIGLQLPGALLKKANLIIR